MAREAVIQLAHGLWRDGAHLREAVVRPLTGADEALIADLTPPASLAERVSTLLAAATRRIGRLAPPASEDVRELTVGDRERLLLALYRLSFGHIEAVAPCPAKECGATLELDLEADDLLVSPNAAAARYTYETKVPREGGDYHVCFRLPTGSDQEQAALIAAADPRSAADKIIRRCVLSVRTPDGEPVRLDHVLPALREPLAEAIPHLDPQADATIRFSCPACGHQGAVLFDAGSFLLARLTNGDSIFAEIHRIARAYHWNEAEILALPVARRQRYLTFIATGGDPT